MHSIYHVRMFLNCGWFERRKSMRRWKLDSAFDEISCHSWLAATERSTSPYNPIITRRIGESPILTFFHISSTFQRLFSSLLTKRIYCNCASTNQWDGDNHSRDFVSRSSFRSMSCSYFKLATTRAARLSTVLSDCNVEVLLPVLIITT